MTPKSAVVEVDGLDLHYLEVGQGPPVLFLHGWPTHAGLWRAALATVGQGRRAIALDLPGFGQSAKPTDVLYRFDFYDRMIDGFLEAIGVTTTGLAVHDLGGPVGLHWAVARTERITDLALCNTLVFPEVSWAVTAFAVALRLPLVRSAVTSPRGVDFAMRTGIFDRSRVTPELLERYRCHPTKADRLALRKTALDLRLGRLHRIANGLSGFTMPTALLYGEGDRILPDVAQTMARVKAQLPHASVQSIPDCGHFLQEDRPDEVAAALGAFFTRG